MKIHLDSLEAKKTVGDVIQKLSCGSKSALIASPYVSGDIAKELLKQVGSVKLLCNARSSASDPNLLQELLSIKDIEIRSFSKLHAKIYCFEKGAIIASANATPNGLGDGLIEAACSVNGPDEVAKVRSWFVSLWESRDSEKVSEYSPALWNELKSRWKLAGQRKARSKSKLSDLIRAKSLPKDMVFIFYNNTDDAPSKKMVALSAEELGLENIPNLFENWNYYIESENYENDAKSIDQILKKYFSYKCVNFRVNDWPFTKIYKRPGFYSTLLDKTIKHKYRKNNLCLSLYRTDIVKPRIILDKEVATILNESLMRNKRGWDKYFNSVEGKFGYCSVKQLYKLLDL